MLVSLPPVARHSLVRPLQVVARVWPSAQVPAQGFAENATGGAGGAHVQVTSLADRGEGTLRALATMVGSHVIEFAVNGTIRLISPIMVAANKTISGRRAAITVTGAGLNMSGVSNVIIECLSIRDVAVDAITVIDGATDIVLRHLTLGPCGDGLIDVTRAAEGTTTRVSVEYCLFDVGDKVMLVGASNDAPHDANLAVSIHHSWFKSCQQRTPRLRYGLTHAWNCLWSDWGGYGFSSGYDASLLVESSLLRAGGRLEVTKHMDPVLGSIRGVGNELGNGAFLTEQSPERVPANASVWYGYESDPNTTRVLQDVVANAGWHLRASSQDPSTPLPEPAPHSPPEPSPDTSSPSTEDASPPAPLSAAPWALAASLGLIALLVLSGLTCRRKRREAP